MLMDIHEALFNYNGYSISPLYDKEEMFFLSDFITVDINEEILDDILNLRKTIHDVFYSSTHVILYRYDFEDGTKINLKSYVIFLNLIIKKRLTYDEFDDLIEFLCADKYQIKQYHELIEDDTLDYFLEDDNSLVCIAARFLAEKCNSENYFDLISLELNAINDIKENNSKKLKDRNYSLEALELLAFRFKFISCEEENKAELLHFIDTNFAPLLEKEDPFILDFYGDEYEFGRSLLEIDYDKAIDIYKILFDKEKDTNYAFILGRIYKKKADESSRRNKKIQENALKYLNYAHLAIDSNELTFLLGECYFRGFDDFTNKEVPFRIFAELFNKFAYSFDNSYSDMQLFQKTCYYIALFYMDGDYVKKDYVNCVKYLLYSQRILYLIFNEENYEDFITYNLIVGVYKVLLKIKFDKRIIKKGALDITNELKHFNLVLSVASITKIDDKTFEIFGKNASNSDFFVEFLNIGFVDYINELHLRVTCTDKNTIETLSNICNEDSTCSLTIVNGVFSVNNYVDLISLKFDEVLYLSNRYEFKKCSFIQTVSINNEVPRYFVFYGKFNQPKLEFYDEHDNKILYTIGHVNYCYDDELPCNPRFLHILRRKDD